MLRELLFSNTKYLLLNKALDKAAITQRVIASNIANVNTPGYQRRGVSFNDALEQAMRTRGFNFKRTRPDHFPLPDAIDRIEPDVVLIDNGYWNGVNNVNIDQEMVDLAANQLDFDTAAQFMHDEFVDLQTAIRGGR